MSLTVLVTGKNDIVYKVSYSLLLIPDSKWNVIEYFVKQLSDEWFAIRRKKITASVACEAVGLSKICIPKELWRHKRFDPDFCKEDNEHMSAGRLNEGPTADKCAVYLGNGTELREVGIFGSERWDWLLASPDRNITAGPHAGMYIEVKYSILMLYEKPKIEHLVQVHVQMNVLNQTQLFLVYGFTDGTINLYIVNWSPAFWRWVEKRLIKFSTLLNDESIKVWPTDKELAIDSVYFETEEFWNTGVVPAHWQRSCTCNIHMWGSTANIDQKNFMCGYLPPKPSYKQLFKGLI